MYKCKHNDATFTNDQYFALIKQEFYTMKENGDFDDYYEDDMTVEEINRLDERLIDGLMASDDDFIYFDMYEVKTLEDLDDIGLGVDSSNKTRILEALKTNESVFVQEGHKVWNTSDGSGQVIAYVNIVDKAEFDNWSL